MDPAYSPVTAVLMGLVIHLLMVAVSGVIFVYLLALLRQRGAPTGRLVFLGSLC